MEHNNNTKKLHFISSLLLLLVFFFNFTSLIHCFTNNNNNNFDQSLDAILHDHAFRAMIHRRPHTGALYTAAPPANLTGIKISVLGIRTRTLFQKGANFSNFVIPPKTIPNPYVKRLAIVYHNLGNWSNLYYNLPGYTRLSPVVGFLVYDASRLSGESLSKIELNTNGNPISIAFRGRSAIGKGAKCVEFGELGEIFLSELMCPNLCYVRNQGHFTVVERRKKKEEMWWVFWILGGLVGVGMVGWGGVVVVRSMVGKRAEEMEKEADEGECLRTNWIGGSKMPRAELTRTQPVIETTVLPNPKLSWYA